MSGGIVGAAGIVVTTNPAGETVISLDPGATGPLLVGPPGPTGPTGAMGPPGVPGKDCTHVHANDSRKRVEFAEKHGGDLSYEASVDHLSKMEAAQEVVLETARRRRALDLEIEDIELRLVSEERALQPELSQAAFERHMKVVLNQDTNLRTLREQRAHVQNEHERAEAVVELARTTIRVQTARLEELGGLFRFYAGGDPITSANDT